MNSLWYPLLAFAFSRGPSGVCRTDADCVLVKSTYCGTLHSITLGQDAAWAEWDAKQVKKSTEAKEACPAGPRPDPRLFDATCENRQCVVHPKAAPVGSARK